MLALELVKQKPDYIFQKEAKNSTGGSSNNVMVLTAVVRHLYPHIAVSKVCSWLVPGSKLLSTSASADR